MTPYYETPLGKLYHGDCLEIMPMLEPVDLVLTDIPFNVKLKYESYKDNLTPEKYRESCRSWFGGFKNLANIYIVKSPTKTMPVVLPVFDDVLVYLWTLIQFSPNSTSNGPFNLNLFTQYLVGGKPYKRPNMDLFKNTHNKRYSEHPAEMPTGPINQILDWFTNENDLILDIFLGSGTTAVSCERLNRRWIGIEISEAYCKIAKERIERERKNRRLPGF